MANTPVDPQPLYPNGFVLCKHSQEEDTPQWVFAFLGTSVRRINEDVAITVLSPEVDPIDFPLVSTAILSFLVNNLHLRVASIGPSTLGTAIVTFASYMDQLDAMGAPFCMEPY
jgi:hypothetical protein